jgi:hypothetical protein
MKLNIKIYKNKKSVTCYSNTLVTYYKSIINNKTSVTFNV